jgi:PHD/YefM family antitoxin component YafN of YafNO toxin-antitoxin module
VLLTSHGRGVAVLQSLQVYEAQQDELAFMRAVVAGLADADAGRTISLEAAKTELGLP